ncbi:MAG: acyl-CoA thioesterase II [Gammaproteobacteria bacterium]|jgi:acyl-CoA thioesterase-2|nr:acyl-CoA thioesterase II [Gammaproteobacteria bacterium]
MQTFTDLMRLKPLSDDRFEAPIAPEPSDRMFGGQFLAQCLRAAQMTLPGDREVHSLHAYFLRPGDVELPSEIQVDRVRDGRGFSSRMVAAHQQGKEMFRMLTSFQVPAAGLQYTDGDMGAAPEPESVAMTYNAFTEAATPDLEGPWPGAARPVDIRYINVPNAPPGEPVTEPQRMWMRIDETLSDDQHLHDSGMAYLADTTLVDHILLPHGKRWQDPAYDGASLDHAMWFHRRCRADEWLLYHQNVETTAGERGLASGRFFNRQGELVVSCMQEGLMR